ncbi:hypothetical protein BKA80DRAFT_80805 [Phyllosticta citrichinensis]
MCLAALSVGWLALVASLRRRQPNIIPELPDLTTLPIRTPHPSPTWSLTCSFLRPNSILHLSGGSHGCLSLRVITEP